MIAARPATKDDLEFIRLVHHLAYHDIIESQFGGWNEKYQDEFVYQDLMTDKHEIVLHDDKPCGYFSFKEGQDHIELTDFAIHPDYQSKGIGGTILERLKEQAWQVDASLSLGVFKTNHRAQQFYERHGFKINGETNHHFLCEASKTS